MMAKLFKRFGGKVKSETRIVRRGEQRIDVGAMRMEPARIVSDRQFESRGDEPFSGFESPPGRF